MIEHVCRVFLQVTSGLALSYNMYSSIECLPLAESDVTMF